jgi:hypothetical protein
MATTGKKHIFHQLTKEKFTIKFLKGLWRGGKANLWPLLFVKCQYG